MRTLILYHHFRFTHSLSLLSAAKVCFLTVVYLPLFAVAAAYKAGTGDNVYWGADGTCKAASDFLLHSSSHNVQIYLL